MKNYNELVRNVIMERQNEYQEVEKFAETIIETIIKNFKNFSINSVILKLDAEAGSILVSGEEVLKNSKALLVYEEVSKMLDSDMPEMKYFRENFYVIRRRDGQIKISINQ